VATTARAPGRFRGAFEEHNEIYLAIRNGEPARAASSMKTHLHNAKTALERAVVENAGDGSAKWKTESKERNGSTVTRSMPNKTGARSMPKKKKR
jgi:hypothetical protein